MKFLLIEFLCTVTMVSFFMVRFSGQTITKNRLIVLTDIEADPDDSRSLIRLLLYSNQIDIEGLIATTSVHQKIRVAPGTIRKIYSIMVRLPLSIPMWLIKWKEILLRSSPWTKLIMSFRINPAWRDE